MRRLLLEHKTKKEKNGKVYESINKGLIQDLVGKYIGGSLFAIPQAGVRAMEEWLIQSSVEFKRMNIWLTEDEVIKLRK